MTVRLIHLGPDDCHRPMVLRSAGYAVEDCASLVQLRGRFARGVKADAVLMSDAGHVKPSEVIAIARARAFLPVILFQTTNLSYEESGVDLVIPCLTPPQEWLHEVGAVIQAARLRRKAAEGLKRPLAAMLRNVTRKPVVSAGPPWVPKTGAK